MDFISDTVSSTSSNAEYSTTTAVRNEPRSCKSPTKTDSSQVEFQLKLLLIFLHRCCRHGYSFQLGAANDCSEIAEHVPGDADLWLTVQTASHPTSEYTFVHFSELLKDRLVTASAQLQSAPTGDCSLVKHFCAYQAVKQSSMYCNGIIKDWIVCSQADFRSDVLLSPEGQEGVVVCPEEQVSSIWKVSTTSDDKFVGSYHRPALLSPNLVEHLKKTYETNSVTYRLATRMAERLFDYQPVSLTDPLVGNYYQCLVDERVIDANAGRLHHDFIKNVDLSSSVQQFRQAFQECGWSILARRRPTKWALDRATANAFWAKAKGKQFAVPTGAIWHHVDGRSAFTLPTSDFDADLEDFRRKVLLVSGLPDGKRLGKILRKEIGAGFEALDVDHSHYARATCFLHRWIRKDRFLPYQAGLSLLRNLQQQLQKWELIGASHRNRSPPVSDCNHHFRDVTALRRLLKSHDSKYVELGAKSTALLTVKVAQALQEWPEDSYAIVDIRLFEERKRSLRAAFASRSKFLLVLEYVPVHEWNSASEELMSDLLQTVATSTNKQVVVIHEPDHWYGGASVNFNNLTAKRLQYQTVAVFHELTDEFQKAIAATHIRFLGAKVRLKDLVAKDALGDVITEEVIEMIARNVDVVTGQLVTPFLSHSALPRKLQLNLKWSSECVVDVSARDLIVVSGASKFDLSQYVPLQRIGIHGQKFLSSSVVILTTDGQHPLELEVIKQQFPNRCVHFLHKDGRYYVWDRSGAMTSVQTEDQLLTTTVNVLCGAPGSGKTTVLSRLSYREKQQYPMNWVINVNLGEYQDLLTINSMVSSEDVFKFLAIVEGLTTEFDYRLLRHQMLAGGRVSLYLDGFEEMGTGLQEVALRMLRTLKVSFRIAKVWLAVRSLAMIEPEDDLSEHRFSLVPLSQDDQRQLLRECCRTQQHWSKQHLYSEVDRLIHSLSKHSKDLLQRFLGLPLILRMIAEICYCKEWNVPEDLLDLYEQFTTTRFRSQWTVDMDPIVASKELDYFRHVHEQLAIKCLFPEVWPKLFGSTETDTSDLELLLNGGLVSTWKNGEACFVHRTVAEYFGAEFFARVLQHQKPAYSRHRTIVDLLTRVFLNEVNDTFRLFLDHRLTRSLPAHHTALSGSQQHLDRDNILSYFKRDALGRLPIHVAAAYGSQEFLDYLLHVVDSNCKNQGYLAAVDDIQCSTLSYAMASSNMVTDFERLRHIVLAILRKGRQSKALGQILQPIMSILENRKTHRLKLVRLLMEAGQRWRTKKVIEGVVDDGAVAEILQCRDDFSRIRHVLEMAGPKVLLQVVRADHHALLRRVLTNGQFEYTLLLYLTSTEPWEVWLEVEDELLNLPEFEHFLQNGDFDALSKVTRKISPEKRRSVWQRVNYKKSFHKCFQQLHVNLAIDLLQIFHDQDLFQEMDDAVTTACFVKLFHQDSQEFYHHDGLFAVLFRDLALPQLREAVLAAIDHTKVFKTAIRAHNRRPLQILCGCCTDEEKMDMKRIVSDNDCLCFFQEFLQRRDAHMISILLRYISQQECREIQQSLIMSSPALALPTEEDLHSFFKVLSSTDLSLMLNILNTACEEICGLSSVWGRLLYVILKYSKPRHSQHQERPSEHSGSKFIHQVSRFFVPKV